MFQCFQPNLYVDSVLDLTPECLQKYEIKSLLLDVDCTLKKYRSQKITPEILSWIETMKENKIGLCLLSNGRCERIRCFAEQVQLPFVAPALKPLPFGCHTAIKTMNFNKKSTAIVGDQVFSDLLAGKFAGLFTILVTPLQPEEEPWFARIKRPLEQIVLRRKGLKKNLL
ncbi:MAG: YqeG family HAD IIIA-type phosphatase [Planctomycetaceae bacterium]|jgi:HAD superfamily phosphatase (TIGR01668 family)|nr:YqeG family HAD IIIA-type phosphatase [Planctomycetaceae bacterium]